MDATLSLPSATEVQVRRLRQLQKEGRHGDVLSQVAGLLLDLPENRDLLLIEATSLRHTLRVPESLATLERLERHHPRFSRLYQERGMCHVALKDAPNAIDALLRAVNINPALPASWNMLERLYRLTGDADKADTAAAHVATLKGLPPEVVTATALFSDGDLGPAEQIVRAFLLQHGDHPEAMRLLARIGMARDVLDDAEVLLEAVLALAPGHTAARYDYAQTLLKRHKHAKAREQIRMLQELDPTNLEYRSLAANAAMGLGEQEAAITIYRDLLIEVPASADLNLWLAHALKTIGRTPEAIDAYRAAAAARPNFGDAYWSLANLKRYRFEDEEIARMRREEASPDTGPEDRFHLCFALGKALEDRGEAAESWLYYERGNALKRSQSRYRPEIIETNTKKQIEVCTPDFFKARSGWGDPRRDPIFILGLPRAGSTLLEQILASHSKVEGTQELPDIQALVLELQGRDPDLDNPRYPAVLNDLSAEDAARMGAKYLADTAVYRSGAPIFIDKMPNNFRHIGLIHPGAGIHL
jgi:predicted Zn-dependent protease